MIFKLKNLNFNVVKVLFFLEDEDIENVLGSSKISPSEKNYKYFIGYLFNDYKIKPLCIMLSKTSAYVKCYDVQTKWMYFLVEDHDLLEKNNTIWDKVNADIKNEFDSKPVYSKRTLKTEIKSNFMVMKVQIFTIKKFLRLILIILV